MLYVFRQVNFIVSFHNIILSVYCDLAAAGWVVIWLAIFLYNFVLRYPQVQGDN